MTRLVFVCALMLPTSCQHTRPMATGPALTHQVEVFGTDPAGDLVCKEVAPHVMQCVDLERFLQVRAQLGYHGKASVEL